MKNMNVTFLSSFISIICLISFSQISIAADSQKSSPSLVNALKKVKQSNKTLWDHWYTVTVKKKEKYQYYHEAVDFVDGNIRYQSQTWKKERSSIVHEDLGAYAENNDDLTPKFFKFGSRFDGTELTIDGTAVDKGSNQHLGVIITFDNQKKPRIEKILKPKTIFSSMFPIWLGKKLEKLKVGQSESFFGVLEDNVDPEVMFQSVPGRIWVQEPDEFSKQTKTAKVKVMFHNLESVWWVERSGAPVKIDLPALEAEVNRTTEKEARNFLN